MISHDAWENLLYAASLRPRADERDLFAFRIDYWKRVIMRALPRAGDRKTSRTGRGREERAT